MHVKYTVSYRIVSSDAQTEYTVAVISMDKVFLQNREARVCFNCTLSRRRKMQQGLPQGSILAPILFPFYSNWLQDVIPDGLLWTVDFSLFAQRIRTTLRRWHPAGWHWQGSWVERSKEKWLSVPINVILSFRMTVRRHIGQPAWRWMVVLCHAIKRQGFLVFVSIAF